MPNRRTSKKASGTRRRVLMPTSRQRDRSLPPAVPLISIVGLMALCMCTIPSVLKQQRVEREHQKLLQESREAEANVTKLRRRYNEMDQSDYLQRRARHRLLHQGTTYLERRNRKLRTERVWLQRQRQAASTAKRAQGK